MITSSLIDEWVQRKVITADQAAIMRADISRTSKDRSSVNIIVALSTIGAIALGLGVIMFVASNWQYLSSFIKVLFLSGGMIGIATLGYLFTYEYKNYVNVGRSLIFLGSLLYCATIFLVAQIYHINAHSHWLILLCLIGILPLVYMTKQHIYTILASFGFYLWLGFVAFRSFSFNDTQQAAIGLPILFLTASTCLFFIGGFHYLRSNLHPVARIYRLSAIAIAGIVLLLLTFDGVSGAVTSYYGISQQTLQAFGQLTIVTVILAVISILLALFYWLTNPTKSATSFWEALIPLTLSLISIAFLLLPRVSDVFTYLFNILFIALTLAVLLIGYRREDMRLINNGVFFTSIYIIVRYFDLFWSLFDRSLFFMLGGVLLVGGGFILESQRRKLKKQFASHE